MSSTSLSIHCGILATELIPLPLGKDVPVTLAMTWRELSEVPANDEINLAFQLFDALMLERPFDKWEH